MPRHPATLKLMPPDWTAKIAQFSANMQSLAELQPEVHQILGKTLELLAGLVRENGHLRLQNSRLRKHNAKLQRGARRRGA